MNTHETIDFLSALYVHDHRTIGDADIQLWSMGLADLPLPLVMEAFCAHIQESTEWTQVAHIRKLAVKIRRDRADRETEEERQARYSRIDAKAAPADRRPAVIAVGPLPERPELVAAIRRMGARWSA